MSSNLVEECPGMFAAENPVEWAFDNLVHFQSGTAASIFQHVSRSDRVVRVSEYPDGWSMLADAVLQMQQEQEKPSPFLPVVHWISHINGVWIGVAEKLDVIEADHPLASVVEAICRALQEGEAADRNEVEAAVPGSRTFRSTLNNRLDIRESNFLRRGNALVFNDPYSQIPHAIQSQLQGTYAADISSPAQALI